jgi:hypothetical protein
MSYRYGYHFKKKETGVMYVSRHKERNILVDKTERITTMIGRLNSTLTGYIIFCSKSLYNFLLLPESSSYSKGSNLIGTKL